MSETASRSEVGMLAKQSAGGFYCREVMIGHILASLGNVPFELALDAGNEIVRFADVHALVAWVRVRTRSRMPSKSSPVTLETLFILNPAPSFFGSMPISSYSR
jgi:hypothetical protein